MSTKLIVLGCVLVLAGYGVGALLADAYKRLTRLRNWIATHDERALLNRQRKAARDREMRKVESTADRAAQMHEIFADVIHPTTPYCDYLDTPRDAMPRVRKPLTEREWGLLTAARDMNKLKADQARRTIDRMEATPTAAELIRRSKP